MDLYISKLNSKFVKMVCQELSSTILGFSSGSSAKSLEGAINKEAVPHFFKLILFLPRLVEEKYAKDLGSVYT